MLKKMSMLAVALTLVLTVSVHAEEPDPYGGRRQICFDGVCSWTRDDPTCQEACLYQCRDLPNSWWVNCMLDCYDWNQYCY